MRLCTVTETGLEFVPDAGYSSIVELEADMKNRHESFGIGVAYTLHEDKPVLTLHEEKTIRLEKK